MNVKTGDRVRVVSGSGLDSGKTGVVMAWQGSGDKWSYKNEDPDTSVWVKYEDGTKGIMNKCRLELYDPSDLESMYEHRQWFSDTLARLVTEETNVEVLYQTTKSWPSLLLYIDTNDDDLTGLQELYASDLKDAGYSTDAVGVDRSCYDKESEDRSNIEVLFDPSYFPEEEDIVNLLSVLKNVGVQ